MFRNLNILMRSAAAIAVAVTPGVAHAAASSLTLFHNNDGESKLLGSGDFGSFDYFLGELNAARDAASTAGRDVLTVSSGDNFLAGLALNASFDRVGGSPAGSVDPINQNYYDALALVAAGYDAVTLGNHEFDFGPDVLADFITGYENAGGTAKFISSNLDFSGEASLAALAAGVDPVLAKSTVVTAASGEKYGIIGATTPLLPTISSPGGVSVGDVAAAVNAEAVALMGAGVDKIILSSHLQSLSNEEDLVSLLQNVDVIIAGGGDELLTNAPDANTTAPNGPAIDGPYPTVSSTTDLDGKNVALVTTSGEYRYIGALEVEFDVAGNVTSVGGNPILVDPATSTNQAVGTFNGINVQDDIINPLSADVAALEAEVIGSTDTPLDGRRASVRTVETNLGDLITDAFVWQAQQIGGLTGDPVIGVTNGGGIRNDSVIDPGDLTTADIFGILPFANSVVVLNGVTVDDLVTALEQSVANVPAQNGGFLQVSGISFDFDAITKEVLRVTLEDGTLLYTRQQGDVFGGTLDLVTNSFTGAGGDGYAVFAGYTAFDLGVSYGDALRNFVIDELGGTISLADYPIEGLARINKVPAPAMAWLFGLGVVGLMARRRFAA